MLRETNLDGVKSIARMLLMTPVHKTPYSPAVVQHPFTSCGIAVARKDGWVQTVNDFLSYGSKPCKRSPKN
jgi:hypothetical protein